ncbi:MAG: hypothetical protein M3680_19255 [Myxococcota bacterium]|nr:hypothetical protein [Myxococcota bacterium]
MLAMLAMLASCSDGETCGPAGAPATGLLVSSADVTLDFGGLSSLAGNDCPDPAAPEGVVSISLEGTQTGGPGLITLCISRPDLLEGGRSLGGATSTADVRVIDVRGTVDGCSYTADPATPPTGTATGAGVCENGTSASGFALTVDGALGLRRTCGATVDSIAVTFRGTVAVTSRD